MSQNAYNFTPLPIQKHLQCNIINAACLILRSLLREQRMEPYIVCQVLGSQCLFRHAQKALDL